MGRARVAAALHLPTLPPKRACIEPTDKKTRLRDLTLSQWPWSDLGEHHRSYQARTNTAELLPQLRFEISEAARILRMSRASLYERIRDGEIKAQKDGRRSYITASELQRYVASKG